MLDQDVLSFAIKANRPSLSYPTGFY